MNPNRNADVPIGINPPQWLRRQSTIHNPSSPVLLILLSCQKILSESKIQCTMTRDFYAKIDSQVIKYQKLMLELFHTSQINGTCMNDRLRFIDLFCGIGGFRIAFERAGARCVFSSDWDKFSQQTGHNPAPKPPKLGLY